MTSKKSYPLFRYFFASLMSIALPIALHNLVMSSLNFFDTLMVGQLGEAPLASVSLANQVYFLSILYLVGVNTGTGIFISQHWGKKDLSAIRRFSTLALILSVTGTFCFFIPAVTAPEKVLGIFSRDPAVVSIGAVYLRQVAPAYLFTSVSFCLTHLLRSTESAILPTISSSAAVIVNILLNYLLIFGKLGFPQLGVIGAAIATVIARGIECLTLSVFVWLKKRDLSPGFSQIYEINRSFLTRYLIIVTPVIANEVFWSMGMVFLQGIYARIGTQAAASMGIMNSIERLSHVLSIGLAAGGAVLVGRTIGEKKRETAERYSVYLGWTAFTTGVIMGLILVFLSGIISGFYSVGEEVRHTSRMMMIFYGMSLPFLVCGMCFFMGVFRASGDTGFCFWFDVLAIWLFQIPAGLMAAFFLKYPAYIVFAFVVSVEIPKLLILVGRLKSGKWYHDLTDG